MTPEQQAEYDRLRRGLPIRLEFLHEDAMRQPQAAADAGELAADLRAAHKQAALRADEVESECTRRIRIDPASFGLKDRPAEAAIASTVLLLKDVRDAKQATIDAEADYQRASALSTAYEHRKSMLKVEAELWVNEYWGDPRVMAKQVRGAVDAGAAQTEARVAEAVKRRRRTWEE